MIRSSDQMALCSRCVFDVIVAFRRDDDGQMSCSVKMGTETPYQLGAYVMKPIMQPEIRPAVGTVMNQPR